MAPVPEKKVLRLPCDHPVDGTHHLMGERYYQCPVPECGREFVVKAKHVNVVKYIAREVWERRKPEVSSAVATEEPQESISLRDVPEEETG